MKYLCEVQEKYRIDSESETKAFIEEQKKDNRYNLKKYASELKERKVKGEIVDSWYQVTLVKVFNDPKEPVEEVEVKYE
jgi:hypothetical protein